MSNKYQHDPVNALSEADATGRAAEIFADIRDVMQIPLVTSIWRTLAGIDGGLEAVWSATRPIYESGQPDALLQKMKEVVILPVPEPVPSNRLELAGLLTADRESILSIFEAYNRSNGMNLIALTALVRHSDKPSSNYIKPPSLAPWPTLRPLLSKNDIKTSDWELLEKTKRIGARYEDPGLPTLWRHLIHWPGLIELVLEYYEPLHQDGSLFRMIEEATIFVESEAPSLSHLRASSIDIPQDALRMVEDYVGEQPSVSRMATLGQCVSNWLASNWIPQIAARNCGI